MRAHKVRRGAKVIRSGQMFKRAFEDAKHVADAALFGKGEAVEKSDEVKPVCITLAILFNDGTTKKYVSVADDFEPEDDDDEDFDDDDECECCDECDDDAEDEDDDEMPRCKACDRKDECTCTKIFARCPTSKCGVCTWEDEFDDAMPEPEPEPEPEDDTHAEIDRLMKRLNELAGKMLAREKAKHHAGK